MRNRFVADIRLRTFFHFNRSHDARFRSEPFKRILKRKAVDDCREHSHMIGPRSVHPGALPAAPDVACTDYDADLDAHIHASLDNGTYLFKKSIVENAVCPS